ncbi:cytochrome b561-like protein [Hoeflea marina]|uniref:Cytochrome b561-like protein n=1 Tax=Hoeflea marina TaxID=274592 RepID=A0A317PRF6_9HYPH|nr:cytochrome b/b6 domain-containing protein [Hoeflea marina]PWW04042.1 cytochrome b561-like protein [Hoeflea marina]
MATQSISPKHTLATRLAHASLATAIILQLASSQFMRHPRGATPGDWLFSVHEYVGLFALLAAFGFWLAMAARRRGISAGLLFPWLSGSRIGAVWTDIKIHLRSLMKLRLPPYEDDAPLASAVHGLGLLLMTFMALTGTIYFIGELNDATQSAFVRLDKEAHELFANLVWAYLIGHAALAVLHHYLSNLSLGEMWSLRRGQNQESE